MKGSGSGGGSSKARGKENRRRRVPISSKGKDAPSRPLCHLTPPLALPTSTYTIGTQTDSDVDGAVDVAAVLAKGRAHRLALEEKLERLSTANAELQAELVRALQECQELKRGSSIGDGERRSGLKTYRLKQSEEVTTEEEPSLLDYM